MAGQSNPGGGMFSQVLGPDYDYSAQILPPDKIGMSADGTMNALADDIGGLMAYVKVLVTGTGKATKTPGPLGSKFFIGTSAQCTDKVSGDNVGRSIYVNNVPDGSIPIMSSGGGGVTFDTFKGLVPGLMSNLAQINPMQILSAFTDGSSPHVKLLLWKPSMQRIKEVLRQLLSPILIYEQCPIPGLRLVQDRLQPIVAVMKKHLRQCKKAVRSLMITILTIA